MSRKIKRLIAIITAVLLFSTVLSSCKKSTSKTIILPLVASTPNCFDPQIASGIDLENIINNCFEGLVRINEDGEIQKGVSDNWSISEDGTKYSFHIRNSAQWHVPKGLKDLLGEDYETTFNTQVTAYDFEFALKRALDKNTNAVLAETLSCIKSVSATNSSQLEIILYKPSTSFMATLATPICMPCNEEFFNATAGRYGLETKLLLCNGPYYISSFDKEAGITLTKNEKYVGDYSAISDYVKFISPAFFNSSKDNKKNTTTTETSVRAFNHLYDQEGGYDAAIISMAEAKKLPKSFDIKKYKNTIKALCFNCNSEQITDDLRLAFVYSTNVNTLVGTGSKAEGLVPACCGLTPGVSYRAGSNIVIPPAENHETALLYIKNATTEDDITKPLDLSLKFVLLKEDETPVKEMIQVWQKVFGVGLSISITACETQEELDSLINGGAYDIAYTSISTTEFLASGFLRSFASDNGKNIISLKSAEYDALLTNIFNSSSKEELLTSNKRAEEFIVKNGYIIPVTQEDSYLAIKNTANDISVRPSGAVYALYK